MARLLHLLCVFALLAVGTACGDEKVVAIGGGIGDTSSDVSSDTDSASDTHSDTNPLGREIVILHDANAPLQIGVGTTQALRVKVIDYELGRPAEEAQVTFTLTRNGDNGDASLSSQTAYTDAGGLGQVTFRANSVGDASYTVQVSTARADTVSFDVFVSDAPRGHIEVRPAYQGAVSIRNLVYRLMPGSYTCGRFSPIHTEYETLSEVTRLNANDNVTFSNLPESQKFTVVATAQGPNGYLAAAGCLDGILIVPNQTNEVTLTLYTLTLMPTGEYDSTSIFDFTGAIPGKLGELVDEITLLFNSPGNFLINQIKRLAAVYVGQFVTDAVFGLFEDAVADVINDWMFNRSPAWLRNILTIGQDLTQVVNNLELEATLVINKLQSDYYIQGRLLWDGIVLYWRTGCPAQGDANYDPNCGRYQFSLSAFSNTQFPMDIIEGRWTGSITNFDQLDIDNHVIRINYGKLILFVLNEMILPAISGHNNITDAILSFINCRSIAQAIYFSALSSIGITVDGITSFCEDGIRLITSPVNLVLSALAVDSQMRMSGHAVLLDENNDLIVDQIHTGRFLGNFESDGQAGAPFTGTWSATRR